MQGLLKCSFSSTLSIDLFLLNSKILFLWSPVNHSGTAFWFSQLGKYWGLVDEIFIIYIKIQDSKLTKDISGLKKSNVSSRSFPRFENWRFNIFRHVFERNLRPCKSSHQLDVFSVRHCDLSFPITEKKNFESCGANNLILWLFMYQNFSFH